MTLIHWSGPGWYAERASVGPRGEGGVQAWKVGESANYRESKALGLGTPFYLADLAAAAKQGEVDCD